MDRLPLILHICCAPDEAWALSCVKDTYAVTCYFCNPNIHPSDEYEKRRAEAIRTAAMFDVPIICDDYDPGRWTEATQELLHTAEGGERCWACYSIRIAQTARWCSENNHPRFGTVLSVSPHKFLPKIDESGVFWAQHYGLEYIPFSFRKKGGFDASVELSESLGIYRQDYCGCGPSIGERDERVVRGLIREEKRRRGELPPRRGSRGDQPL